MTLRPTHNHLRVLLSIEQSIAELGEREQLHAFECVELGWLVHREHRSDEGAIRNVWTLTDDGQRVLSRHGEKLIEAA